MDGLLRPELLSPAGNYESFLCAVNAGADAVYLAGKSFGARAYAGNFSDEELLRALDYAHLNDKKVYITVNTLLKEQEIELLYDYLKPFYEEGLDGVIVQDFGVLSLIKREFPLLPIHASTQMTVTSVYGAKALLDMGVKRVVPARELTIGEVKSIVDTGIETECFIHGALCYCYSGQCYFSSIIGGRSGNRGRCAQPCRLSYSNEAGRNGYFLSLKDLCTIDYLPELIQAGIHSFKIEGRMKNPAYVYRVTQMYNRYIEEYLSNPEKYRVKKEDRRLLEHFYVRTGVGKGYYEGNRGRDMVTVDHPGYAGSLEEDTEEIIREFGIERSIRLKGSASFEAGKPCRLQITEPEAYTYTGPVCEEAKKAPLSKEELQKRMLKTGDTFFVFDDLEINVKGNVFLPVSVLNEFRRNVLEEYRWMLLAEYQRGEQKESCGETNHSADTDDKRNPASIKEKKVEATFKDRSSVEKPEYIVFVNTKEQLKECLKKDFPDEIAVPVLFLKNEKIKELLKNCGRRIDLCLPAVLRKDDKKDFSWKKELSEIGNEVYINKIYVNQLDSFYLCREMLPKARLSGDIHFYQMNTEAVRAFEGELTSFTLSPELNKEELKELKGLHGELILYGRLPLMNTYNCVLLTDGACRKSEGFTYIKDRKGAVLPIFCHCGENFCYNTIYNSVPTCLTRYGREIMEIGADKLQLRFTDETPEQTGKILKLFEEFDFYGERVTPDFPYTNGHLLRGIE